MNISTRTQPAWKLLRSCFPPLLLAALLVGSLGCGAEEEEPSSDIEPPTEIAVTRIFLVRHAEKQSEGDDPDLTEAGAARAAALADVLSEEQLTAIFTSEFARTKQTCAPTGERQDLAMEELPGREPEATAKAILSRQAGGTYLVCGHSNTVPVITRSLGVTQVADLSEDDYGDLFQVTIDERGSSLRMARFGD